MNGADHPAVKDGVRLAAVAEGAYLEHAGRSFVLRGRGLHPLIARMLSAIDGGQAPELIEAALPEAARPLFRTLLDRLGAAAMLTSGARALIADDHPHADTLRFLREATPDWRTWFATWSTRPIAIDAPPPIAALLARRLAECGAGSVVEGGVVADARLLIAVEDGSATSSGRAYHARPDTCLVARPHADGAVLVGRRDGDVEAAWRTIAAATVGERLAPLARETLSAMLAFEALWSCAPADADREGRAAFTDVRVLRADGRVVRHPAAIATASGRLDVAAPAPIVAPSAADGDWFDPAVGPFQRVDDDLAPYPLAHCSLVLRAGPAAGATVRGWGLDADAAEAAALEQAIAMFEAARTGWSPAAGRSPVVVAADEARFRADAGALARVALPGYAACLPREAVDPNDVRGDDARTLLRLLRLYAGRWPTLWTTRAGPVVVTWARLDGHDAVGVSIDPERAWTDVLGDLLSAVQVDAPSTRQAGWPITALRDAPTTGDDAAPPVVGHRCRIVRLTGDHLGGRVVGYAEIAGK